MGLAASAELVEKGRGNEVLAVLKKRVQLNIVSFHAWTPTFGESTVDQSAMLGRCIALASADEFDPKLLDGIFEEAVMRKLKPAWDALSVTLWAMNPARFFPIKISYYRRLAKELGWELPGRGPTAAAFLEVMAFGEAFRDMLSETQFTDWTDIQSFIWEVCLAEDRDDDDLAPEDTPNNTDAFFTDTAQQQRTLPAQYWWFNFNPDVFSVEDRFDIESAVPNEPEIYTAANKDGNKRQKPAYFAAAQRGDLAVAYVTSPIRHVLGLCRITRGMTETGGVGVEFILTKRLPRRLSIEELQQDERLTNCEPVKKRQGSLFRLTAEEYEIILELADQQPEAEVDAPVAESYTTSDALKDLFMTRPHLDRIMAQLRRKKNLILQGAPGTGKTFIAGRLAYLLMEQKDKGRVEMVQFHQSSSYEDFIQGIRPEGTGFSLRDGVFHTFCRRAMLRPGMPHVFIIDEINRGNLSKIFGELMMLIEPDKRGRQFAMRLSYSQDDDEKFFVPENVYLIGTMNTADRSLSLVDYALRRRFAFWEMQPGFEVPQFGETLTAKGVAQILIEEIRQRMGRLNQLIADDRNLGNGYRIGHSFFVPTPGVLPDTAWSDDILTYEILPLIEEYWVDDDKKLKEARDILQTRS